jgi:ATP-binding cassette, subfamily B, bacterial
MAKFPFYRQADAMDCGPTCLKMIAKYYGKSFSLQSLRIKTEIGKDGVNVLGIHDAAESLGFRTRGVQLTFEQLKNDAVLPCVAYFGQDHFVVITKDINDKRIIIADPAEGIITIDKKLFLSKWINSTYKDEELGVVLLLEPTPKFYEQEDSKEKTIGWGLLYGYILPQKQLIFQLFLGLIISSLLQLIFPFLTQSIVDTGINTHNLHFIYIILIAQFMLFFSRTIVDFVRSKILLHISTKTNISLLSDFWSKLMRLPLSFFDTKQTGDIIQRVGDHHRIEQFLTGSTLNTLFSIFSIIMFSFVLLNYNYSVFTIFSIGSLLYLFWVRLFLKYRRSLDYKRFEISSKENSATLQLIHGMQEIKLNNSENSYRWAWEDIQAALFKLNFRSLTLSQYQQAGALFINEGKNILITFFVAKAVLDGHLSLGAMLAIQYIIGQLNGPIEQLVGFTQQAQDAKISLERLNEIHQIKDEEPIEESFSHSLPSNKSISLNNLTFTYTGAGNEPVLKNLTLLIPEGKVTAIVGTSGSGKTTILKLLQKFYTHYKGEIKIGESNLKNISPKYWRSLCGNVMQDGYIFNDSIAKNITVNDDIPNIEQLQYACTSANILSFVEGLPLGFNTKIGNEGNGISAGQKQRLLIARAIYKNPQFLFFDEATNALDANNEKVILENLNDFFQNKTVIVVAHRLSTVKNADKIVVLHEGEIAEEGTHEELTQLRGQYFELVKNQLELGN